jgi:hypothetical protein
MPKEDNYLLKTFLPCLESFHYSRLNVPTFVEDYPFGTIKKFNEDNVRFWTLFEKCTMVCKANFYRNWLTFIVNSLNFPFFFFLKLFLGSFHFRNLCDISIFGLPQLLFVYSFKQLVCLFLKRWKNWCHEIFGPLVN